MNQGYVPSIDRPVFEVGEDARATFIARTYAHLFGAMGAFVAIEFALFKSGVAERIAGAVGQNWFIAFGAFMVVSWLARGAAHRAKTLGVQYIALAAFVSVWAVLFVPLLYIADAVAPGAIASAAVVTLGGFAGLTFIAFWTRKDFSFLRGILNFGGVLALLAIVGGMIFGFQLGTWFSVGMVGLMGASILYDTSNVLHHYPENRYVAASIELFGSVALMFWYVLQLFTRR